jgi:hypothetical protein
MIYWSNRSNTVSQLEVEHKETNKEAKEAAIKEKQMKRRRS